MATLRAYCQAQHIRLDEWVEEMGSELNYQQNHFNRIMEVIELGQLTMAHQDRLVRFGFDWFAAFCQWQGTNLIIVNGNIRSPEQELVQDLVSIVYIFSAHLDGLRSYKEVIRHAALQKNPSPGQ